MVLGLTPHDLRQAAAALAGSPVGEVRVSAVSERAGLNSATSSAVVTVELASQVVQLFVKSNAVLHRHEAARYRALAGTVVPAPRLLLAVDRPPVEVIVLEALDRIGIDPSSPTEVLELLRLCARLNAAAPEVAVPAPSPGQPAADFDAAVLRALHSLSVDISRWSAAYRLATSQVDSLPTALCHGELYVQQVGWSHRGGVPTLVVFDLETLAYRPRFTDIASILNPLAQGTGRSQIVLFSVYLEELRRLTGNRIDVEAAFAELRLVRFADACWGMPWMLRQHDAAPGSVPLAETIRCMHEDLPAIGG